MKWSMTVSAVKTAVAPLVIVFAALASVNGAAAAEKPPAVGEEAKDFELTSLGGEKIKLSKLNAEGPVVLVMLRGYSGYQCPLCTRQVGELIGKASAFEKADAKVLLVYPGPAKNLKERAKEFVRGKNIPEHFFILLDPDYEFTNQYGLRWNAPSETAYPSTFVIDKSGKVAFATISKTHGDRAKTDDVLKALVAR